MPFFFCLDSKKNGGASNFETPPGASLWCAATGSREVVGVVADHVRENCLVDSLQMLLVAVANLDVAILVKVSRHRLLAESNLPLFPLVAESSGENHVACARNESHDLNQVRLEDQSFDPKNSLLFAHIRAPPYFIAEHICVQLFLL